MFDNRSRGLHEGATKVVFENLKEKKRSLWNVNTVAEFLGVSPRTVRDWVYRRLIPYRKVGTSLRFSPDEIERWTLPNKE